MSTLEERAQEWLNGRLGPSCGIENAGLGLGRLLRTVYREGERDALEAATKIALAHAHPDAEGYKEYLKTMRIGELNDGADIAFRGAAHSIFFEIRALMPEEKT